MKRRTARTQTEPAISLVSSLRYDRFHGLSAEEVERSRAEFGSNVLTVRKRDGFFVQFLKNFNDPIIRILLVSLVINMIVSWGKGNLYESIGIAVAVLISTLVSTVSEYSSARAFETLCIQTENSMFTVRRDGILKEVQLSDLVTGDILYLSAGSTVPADGILTDGTVSVDQSPITGESEARKKTPYGLFERPMGVLTPSEISCDPESIHHIFRGSRVCSGEGELLIVRVGRDTLYGTAATGLQDSTRPSPLKERLAVLAASISRLGYAAAALIALIHLLNVFVVENGWNTDAILRSVTDPAVCVPHLIHALTMAISVLVVAVPEGLPMMITVVLSSNMKKMLKAGVLVRRMVGIETAGSLNMLFTDKTGTLTTGKLRVEEVVTANSVFTSAAALGRSQAIDHALRLNHRVCGAQGHGNVTDGAINRFFGDTSAERIHVMERLPFDSSRRYAAGVGETGGTVRTWIRGAPEVLLAGSAYYLGEDGRVSVMTEKVRTRLQSEWKRLTEASYRVIAAAEMDGNGLCDDGTFHGLVFVALYGIRDHIRSDAVQAVRTAQRAGIRTVMITGDNERTAEAIARTCGIMGEHMPGKVITGEELRLMSDETVAELLPNLSVVARALPGDKSRLVRLAQASDMVVGMTGDGINDAPALRAADVGFAMGSGTDAAKEAGDIVITDDCFCSIIRAVLFGRNIFLSIRKFITFQLTMNLCAVGVSLIGPMFGVEHPVTVIQMLWVNIIMDTLGALAFAGEPPLERYLRRKPFPRSVRLLSGRMIRNILCGGIYSLGLCLWFLKSEWMHRVFHRGDTVYYLTVFFALFVFCGIFNGFLSRTEGINIFSHISGNKPFVLIMLLVAAVQLLIIYLGGSVFRCEVLTLREIVLAALIACTVIPMNLLLRILWRNK